MLVDGIGHFGEPRSVFGQFKHVARGKEFDTGGRTAQRLEQTSGDKNGDIVRLAI